MLAIFLSNTDTFGEKVSQLINDGIALINSGLENSIGTTLIEMCIQLCATLIIFLIARFFVWNKITAILDERKKVVKDALKERDEALKQRDEALKEIEEEKKKLQLEAVKIIENAKRRGYNEEQLIIENANAEAKLKISNAKEEIERMRIDNENEIKKEIVDIAYLMASKIVSKEILKDNQDVNINEFIKGSK